MGFHEEDNDTIRSSRLQMFFKIGVLKYFAIFTGKQNCMPDGLLHRPEKLLHRYFPVKTEIFKSTFFTDLQWLLFYYLIASRSVTYFDPSNYLI